MVFYGSVLLILMLTKVNGHNSYKRSWVTTDELENHISPDDLLEFLKIGENATTSATTNDVLSYAETEDTTNFPVPETVDCFGLGPLVRPVLSLFNMKPDTSENVNTHFYFSSRTQRNRVQVYPGNQFGLEWVDFDANRRTVLIIHGFMSHSNASWVNEMTRAFLDWADVNVIAVDWSGGGNTWKYWRAVANAKRVVSDVNGFMRQLMSTSGAKTKSFHFVGHSLGAHIAACVSFHIGGVARITGLDPAQPCFNSPNSTDRLDPSDADFVDVIHTNGRLLTKLGLGLPDPIGHADFYPNGGMKQPGCYNNSNSVWSSIFPSLQQAICSHGRAYLLFTESLINNNCSFRAYKWNLTYEGVNASIRATCDNIGSCSEMGIKAVGAIGYRRAKGPYFVLTTDKEPYCPSEMERQRPQSELLHDLRQGFRLDRSLKTSTVTVAYADPDDQAVDVGTTTTEASCWFRRIFGRRASSNTVVEKEYADPLENETIDNNNATTVTSWFKRLFT
ncbi:pancreatic triacylglycerol lipase isoform X2 [Bombyx mori]|uniref:Lipase domain-containing protein n=1 Tax=Bombyx mori TaxID=7091 RepID=A0A8R2M1F8_BOMMO|nr:pancreatic triacylglycerol lipase isoform X2 [Bombyx mori]